MKRRHTPSPRILTLTVLLLCLIVSALPALAQGTADRKEAEPTAAHLTVLWALGITAGLFFLLFVIQLLVFGDTPQIVSHWGGFGGGLGGWRLSPSAALLLAALALSVLVVFLTPRTETGSDSERKTSGSVSQPAPSPNPSPTPGHP